MYIDFSDEKKTNEFFNLLIDKLEPLLDKENKNHLISLFANNIKNTYYSEKNSMSMLTDQTLAFLVPNKGNKERIEFVCEQLKTFINEINVISPITFNNYDTMSWIKKGIVYVDHPRGVYDVDYENIILPITDYESTLISEKKSELKRLLADLGAKEIVITENYEQNVKKDVDTGAKLNRNGILGKWLKRSSENTYKQEKLKLKGKKIKSFDISNYAWVDKERAWSDIIYSRLNGYCTEAEILIDLSQSSTSNLNLDVKIFNVAAHLNNESAMSKVYNYHLYVRF